MAQAVFSNEDVKRSVTLYVAYPEDIRVIKELTGRKSEETEIAALAADIYANGQSTPVLVRKSDKGDAVLVYGHRRRAAVAYINKHLIKKGEERLKVQCKYENLSEIEALKAAISENRFRKDVSAVDDAYNIEVLQKRFKLSVEDVAAIYFPEAVTPHAKSEAVRWVKVRAGLQELAPEAKEAVRDGNLKVTAAAAIAKLPKDKQREVIAAGGTGLKSGKKRIKVADIKKAAGKTPAKAPAKAAPAPAPAKASPQVAPTSTIYGAAEALAVAVDAWVADATDKAEKALIAAHGAYRKLVPARPVVAEAKA